MDDEYEGFAQRVQDFGDRVLHERRRVADDLVGHAVWKALAQPLQRGRRRERPS